MPVDTVRDRLHDVLAPLESQARNQGFPAWRR